MTNRIGIVLVGVVVAVGVYGALTVGPSLLDQGGPGIDDGTAGEVTATHTSFHLDRTGRPTVVGEVLNRRSESISAVEVTVTFYHDGEVVGQTTDQALRSPVAPDSRSPFNVHLGSTVDQPVDNYTVDVSYEPFEGDFYDGLTVQSANVSRSSQDAVVLTGTVRNDGDRTVGAQVIATFYSENDTVVGVRATRPSPGQLEAGESGVFRVNFRTLGDVPSLARQYDHYRVVVVRISEGGNAGDGSRAALTRWETRAAQQSGLPAATG